MTLARVGNGPDPMDLGAHCSSCPLGRKRHPVFATPAPSGRTRLIIVGEAPGELEQRIGRPFLGRSGQFLDHLLTEANGETPREFTFEKHATLRRDAYLTNASLCRSDSDKENDHAAMACAPRLYRELAVLPKETPILALGSKALRSILNVRSILLARGFVWETKEIDADVVRAAQRKYDKTRDPIDRVRWRSIEGRAKLSGRTVLPTLHPAFILRSDIWRPIIKVDVSRYVRLVTGELDPKSLKDEAPNYVVVRRREEVREALNALGPQVTVDIETDHAPHALMTKTLCVGVGDLERAIVIGPWSPVVHALILSEYLRKEKRKAVIMHNGWGFDRPALMKDGVTLDEENQEDTLIAHHSFASHFPQRLDHVVATYLDSTPWKIVFGRRGAEEKGVAPDKMPKELLYKYNSGDISRTIGAWHEMQGDLETVSHVYEHDKAMARIAMSIFMNGIAVDEERKALLSRLMKRKAWDLRQKMRKLVGDPMFHPARNGDIRKVLYDRWQTPILNRTPTGLPSTAVGTMEALSNSETEAGKLCAMILDWRGLMKARGTYLEPVEVSADGRAHFPTKSFGTVTGRFAGRFLTLPRVVRDKKTKEPLLETRIREIYVPEPGSTFVYFDVSQAEMNLAAYLSGDEKFIAEMLAGDPYMARAKQFFQRADAEGAFESGPDGKPIHELGKQLRQITKTASLAANYLAEPETVYAKMLSEGFKDTTLAQVGFVIDKIHTTYRRYFRYVQTNIAYCTKHGYLQSPIVGRKRWMGFFPSKNEISNFPIQSGIADIMNLRLIDLVTRRLPRGRRTKKPLGWKLVAQVHDACVFECKEGKWAERVGKEIKAIWEEPVIVPPGLMCRDGARFVLKIDQKVKSRYSEL